jgi:hypothetical protein
MKTTLTFVDMFSIVSLFIIYFCNSEKHWECGGTKIACGNCLLRYVDTAPFQSCYKTDADFYPATTAFTLAKNGNIIAWSTHVSVLISKRVNKCRCQVVDHNDSYTESSGFKERGAEIGCTSSFSCVSSDTYHDSVLKSRPRPLPSTSCSFITDVSLSKLLIKK